MDSLGSDFRKIFDDNTSLAPDRVQNLSDATGIYCRNGGSYLERVT